MLDLDPAAGELCAPLPFVLTEYEATLAGFVGIAAIAAIGLVLLTGISGQTSFGHATFVGGWLPIQPPG